MWSSLQEKGGCFAWPRPPEGEDINEGLIAKHKGLDIATLRMIRTAATKRIEAVLLLQQLFSWWDQEKQEDRPWGKPSTDVVVRSVNNWCQQHWPYNVKELGWTYDRVALTLHEGLLERFNGETGKQVDWVATLGLDAEHKKQLIQIFNIEE
jgi:hypothetical protein